MIEKLTFLLYNITIFMNMKQTLKMIIFYFYLMYKLENLKPLEILIEQRF